MLASRKRRRFEQLLRRLHIQIVRHVEDVRDNRQFERRVLKAEVNVGERNGMSRCGRTDTQAD